VHVLFDIGHPAHVHLFRHLAKGLLARGDSVKITIRDRGITGQLLETYGLPYSVASRPRSSILGMAIELLIHNWNVLRACLKQKPDYLIGTSVSAAHVGWLIRRKSVILNEDDADYVPLFAKLTYPFASYIVTPSTLRDLKTPKYRIHESYHELAYLHPDHFTPDSRVLKELGVTPGEPFSILRLVSLTAHHDVGQQGISYMQAERLVALLSRHGKVFVNGEKDLPESLQPYAFRAPPEAMHSLIAFAQILVSDSQTMTIEAAVLGTPAFRCNSFVDQCSVISEIEDVYQLAWGYKPEKFNTMCYEIDRLLADSSHRATLKFRRERMLANKINLADWLLRQLDNDF
jgi:predicted glycosyltransferase